MDKKQLIRNLKACAGGKACVGCSLFDTPNDCVRRLMGMAADALEGEGWIPVGETGPALTLQKDPEGEYWESGTLLLAVDGKAVEGICERTEERGTRYFKATGEMVKPTHWMAMPEAPHE